MLSDNKMSMAATVRVSDLMTVGTFNWCDPVENSINFFSPSFLNKLECLSLKFVFNLQVRPKA